MVLGKTIHIQDLYILCIVIVININSNILLEIQDITETYPKATMQYKLELFPLKSGLAIYSLYKFFITAMAFLTFDFFLQTETFR